jgi:MFS family permease
LPGADHHEAPARGAGSQALTLASLLLTSGALADRYGRKRLFAIGLTIFTLGSLLCGGGEPADAHPVPVNGNRC